MELNSLEYALSLVKAQFPAKKVSLITPMSFANGLPEAESPDIQYFGELSSSNYSGGADDFAINLFGVAPILIKATTQNVLGSWLCMFRNVYHQDNYLFVGWQIKLVNI